MVTAFRCIALLTASFLALAGPWPHAQTGAPGQARPNPQAPSGLTFRVESNYVEVDAVVTDPAGSFVRDLKASDFDVREDSHPQNVDVFSLVDIPFERVDRPANRPVDVDPDVSTNTKEFNGRVYLIVLDSLHVAAAHTAQVKRQAKQFIEQSLAANDLAAVVQVGDAAASQEFTSSRATLLAAVDRFVGRKLPSSVLNLIADAKAKEGRMAEASPPRDPDVAARAAQAKQALDSIARLSDYMAGIRGRRKAVLLFSEGIDFNTDDVLGPAPSPAADIRSSMESREAPEVLDSEQLMIGAATRGNVSLYTVDPRGIAGPDDITILSTGMPGASDGAPPQPVTADVQAEILRGQTTLRVFAEQTGGLAHTGSNDFTGAFARIVQDNSSYYVLGYYAATTKRDGKFHDITVKVKRPGLQVRARKGYYAPKANAIVPQPDVMRDLLQSPMPMAGLPMRLVAQVTKGTAGKAHVYLTVEVEGHDLPLDERAGAFVNKLEFSYAAFDLDAQRQASGSKAVDLNFNAQSRKAVADGGLRVTTQFDIAPGRYQLRLAGHEALGNTSGSVFRDLEVPDFAKPPLAMSDLIVTSSSAGSWPTTTDATMLKDLLPGPVTAERAFALEATMVAYAEVYDNDLAHPHDVDFTATVRTHDGDQVFVTRDAKKSTDATPERGYAFMPRIPLADLVPGRYLLTVEARSSAGGVVTKEIPFTIK